MRKYQLRTLPSLVMESRVHPDSKEEADRIFRALSAGGSVEMQIADQPWGDYRGSFKDKFGVLWMVDYGYPETN